MWAAEHTIETTAAPEAIWRLWADVPRWPEWNQDLARAELTGEFVAGSTIRMTSVEANRSICASLRPWSRSCSSTRPTSAASMCAPLTGSSLWTPIAHASSTAWRSPARTPTPSVPSSVRRSAATSPSSRSPRKARRGLMPLHPKDRPGFLRAPVSGLASERARMQDLTPVLPPPSASAVADGGELLGQAAAEGRHACEEA
jgi:hypothetical protein